MWCDCCGDTVKVVFPCKFIFHDKKQISLNICLDCMQHGTLEINLHRSRLVSKILYKTNKLGTFK